MEPSLLTWPITKTVTPSPFASCIRAEEADSVLMVLSGKTFQEAQAVPDSYRFNQNYWSLNE